MISREDEALIDAQAQEIATLQSKVTDLTADLAEANGLLDEIEEQWFNNRSRNFLEFGGKLTAILAKRKGRDDETTG